MQVLRRRTVFRPVVWPKATLFTILKTPPLPDQRRVARLAGKLLGFEPTHRRANLALLRHHLGRDERRLAAERIQRYIRHYRHQLGWHPDPDTLEQMRSHWGGELDGICGI
jgi:predicted metal-dependent hydrolase